MAKDPRPTPVSTIPLHAALLDEDGRVLRVRRRPGRPRLVTPARDVDELAWLEESDRRLQVHIDRDDLTIAVHNGEGAEAVLCAIKIGIATEAANLKWEAIYARDRTRQLEQIRSRRIDALCKLSRVVIDECRAGIDPDLSPARVATLKNLWLEVLTTVARQTMPADTAETFLERYGSRLAAGMSNQK